MPDILFILVLALIIFGPKKLPEVARQLAKFMAQFRMMRDDFRRQLQSELLKIELEEKQKEIVPPPVQAQAQTPTPEPKSLPEASTTYSQGESPATSISGAGA